MFYICITKGNEFQKPDHRIISIEEFVDGINGVDSKNNVEMFNDYTTNFVDLGYWESKVDLHKLNVLQVKCNLEKVLKKMEDDGYKMYQISEEDKNSYTIPGWVFGHCKMIGHIGPSIDLPDDQRKSILMLHLKEILDVIKEYNNEYYMYLDGVD